MSTALIARGITEEFLAERLWDELHATITKTAKLKGQVQDALPEGCTIIAETEDETLIEWQERAWNIQQSARMDAQKLMAMYPAEKLDVTLHNHETSLDELE